MFFGAITLGTLADYLGRRRMFLINLGIYSGFTLAAAFAPDLTWLAILRFLAGFGLGAELSLSDTYLSEPLPRQDDARGTPQRWGTVPRAFVRTTEDNTIPLALQDRMIAEADAATPDNRFVVRTLASSHSPFASMPDDLATVLADL